MLDYWTFAPETYVVMTQKGRVGLEDARRYDTARCKIFTSVELTCSTSRNDKREVASADGLAHDVAPLRFQ